MKMTTVQFSEEQRGQLDAIKKAFGVRTNADMLRKAISLAALAASQADEQGNIQIGSGSADKAPVYVNVHA
ncbi:hypothetical protein FHR90_003450 [Endobacter medicaginis]|uniref:Uncharacterized protein n=1 Tax=Endobacter medicaginis TaxID=1181271 RepID=A0A850NRD2_9PROT|nr:hypothetical protein [Endobacter medicaginis]MBB3175588.1 hypothetical protein [Endobacter medicaginis]MCX5476264.1 hypothetical protein [Endobacter medicaginis]NVN30730.1 hypothetical protein [Endobacter medicaginis]